MEVDVKAVSRRTEELVAALMEAAGSIQNVLTNNTYNDTQDNRQDNRQVVVNVYGGDQETAKRWISKLEGEATFNLYS